MIIVVMGISGSGKTTIGKLLASRLEVPFYDGDDFHPEANIQKMAAGRPLTDEDRWPWLEKLGNFNLADNDTLSLVFSARKTKCSRTQNGRRIKKAR